MFALTLLTIASAQLIPGKYIVQFKSSVQEANVDALIKFLKVEPEFRYTKVFQGFAGSLPEEVVSRLRAHPLVENIEQDQMMHAIGSNKTADANLACSSQTSNVDWGQARVCQVGAAASKGTRFNYDSVAGEGIETYVIDTGILVTHEDFEGRARFGFKASSSWSNTDGNGHGTHVASEMVGITYGLAKKATVVAVKVLSDSGSGSNAGVIAGVDWTLAEAQSSGKKTVVNLSLGGSASSALDAAINALADSGVVVAVAAGNDNHDACNDSPARAAKAITVGSTAWSSTKKDHRSSFSNYGPCVDIFGPGSDIKAAWIGSNSATRTISGTSMASPHVAGVATLIWGESKSLSARGVEGMMTQFANRGVISMDCSSSGTCSQSPNILVFAGCDC